MNSLKIGFIPAHRDLMDEEYAKNIKNIFINKFKKFKEIDVIYPDDTATKNGLVRSEKDAEYVLKLFYENNIDAIIIGAITYGDEKSVFTIVEKFKDIPVFLFAVKDPEIPDNKYFKSAASCGAMPISFGLHRRNIKFTFGGIFGIEDKDFEKKVNLFIKVVFAVKKFKYARIGMIGSRPNDFEICAFNEADMIERYGQRIISINLLDIEHKMGEIKDNSKQVTDIIQKIISNANYDLEKKYLIKTAKLEILMLKYANDFKLNAYAIQCWTSIQEYIGLTPCINVGRITSLGFPVACEGDVHGALTLLIQYGLVTMKKDPMFLDILMQHPVKKDLFLAWHCGNASIANKNEKQVAMIKSHCPFADSFGLEKGSATIEFMFKPGIVNVNRLVEHNGVFKMLNFTGEMIESDDNIRGAWSWVRVKDREKLYSTIFNEGFTHHVSIIHENISDEVKEFCKYFDIEFIGVD